MRVAVSGVNGFVGGHLVTELTQHGHDVVGLGMGPAAPGVATFLADYVDEDLTSGWPDIEVHAVVHLAGLAAVGPSFADPQAYLHGNSAPVTHLCEQLLARSRSPRVVVVSSGAVYVPGVGLDEKAATQASSPYVVSKLLVELQSEYYRRRGLDVTVMRPFNHIGPGQHHDFLLPDLIAGVSRGALTAGNLETRRDYTDVRDVSRAYRLAVEAEHIHAPTLNVCSGVAVSGRELLELVAREFGVPVPEPAVDPARLRPDDPPEITGDNTLVAEVLGWKPAIDLAATVHDTVSSRR